MDANELKSMMNRYCMEDSDVAESLQVRQTTVFKWRTGKKRIPDHYANIINGWREPNAHPSFPSES
jgi:DNA-binding transcriptional regulator YiaG